ILQILVKIATSAADAVRRARQDDRQRPFDILRRVDGRVQPHAVAHGDHRLALGELRRRVNDLLLPRRDCRAKQKHATGKNVLFHGYSEMRGKESAPAAKSPVQFGSKSFTNSRSSFNSFWVAANFF